MTHLEDKITEKRDIQKERQEYLERITAHRLVKLSVNIFLLFCFVFIFVLFCFVIFYFLFFFFENGYIHMIGGGP
jgi:ABC-type multidrug transport system permease subunit